MFKKRPAFLSKRSSLFGSNPSSPPAATPSVSSSLAAPTTSSSFSSTSPASKPSLAEPAVSPLVAAARREEEERAQGSTRSPYVHDELSEAPSSPSSSAVSRSRTAPNPASLSASSSPRSSLSSTLSEIEKSFGEPAAATREAGRGLGLNRTSEWHDAEEEDGSVPLVEGGQGGRRTRQDAEAAFKRLAEAGASAEGRKEDDLLVNLDEASTGPTEDEIDTLPSLKPTPPSPALQKALSPPAATPLSIILPSPSTHVLPPPPTPSNSLPAEESVIHQHRHHHSHSHPHDHHAHAHSPPVAAPPPLRAATMSATSDLSKMFNVGTSNGNGSVGKRTGFIGLVRSSSKNSEAKAAAARALQANNDALSPTQKVERAKHAERAHLLQICMELGVEIHDMPPDGHCLYRAIADQLSVLKLIKEDENHPATTRLAAATYMRNNVDAFLPFLSCPLPGADDVLGPNGEDPGEDDGMITAIGYERYCQRVESSGVWGGEPEILAMSRYYKIPIHVVQASHPKIVAHSPDPKAAATLEPKQAKKIRACRISYHRRLYGLGEHYNSLRKISYNMNGFAAMVPM